LKRLLVILIDGFRYEYVSEKNTPYLHSVGQTSFQSQLKPILGYSDSIQATIFTGAYPDEHGYWMKYKYGPASSPFKFLRLFRFIDRLPPNIFVRGAKFAFSITIGRLLAKFKGYSDLSLHNIPLRVIDSFDQSLRKSMFSREAFPGFPTFFDALGDNNIKYASIDASEFAWWLFFSSSVKVRQRLVKALDEVEQDTGLIFVSISNLDIFAHRKGLKSPLFWEELTNMDSTIKLVVDEMEQKFSDELDVMIFSDHGMEDTTHFVDLKELRQDEGLGRDYLVFFDSTIIQVWYLNQAKKQELRSRIESLSYGHFLSQQEKKELGLNFDDNGYGDDIFLLDAGYSIFPNFYSWLKPYAMHAYHPDIDSQRGIFMLWGEGIDVHKEGPVLLVDIAPTILDILGVEPLPTFKAKSLLE